jgi:hypothetical protein
MLKIIEMHVEMDEVRQHANNAWPGLRDNYMTEIDFFHLSNTHIGA